MRLTYWNKKIYSLYIVKYDIVPIYIIFKPLTPQIYPIDKHLLINYVPEQEYIYMREDTVTYSLTKSTYF